jgi:methionyl-tRNA formyltransferase
MALRVLFFGTPEFAVPSLLALVRARHQVVGVISQPDRPRGRGQHVQFEAVKKAALEHQLAQWQPDRLKDPALLDALRALEPDLAVVAAYGRLLPQALLDLPRLGFINVHASLLPRWRGAAPVHRAILAGDETTGVTIMRVVLALDAGPMLARRTTSIDPNETSGTLEARLATIGAGLLAEVVDRLSSGAIDDEPQDDRMATYAAKLERSESQTRWDVPARDLHNRIRGLQPWPLAAASLRGRRILLLESNVEDDEGDRGEPGTILAAGPDGLVVATRAGAVRLLRLQPEGRRAMPARDFLNGTRLAAGERFDVL